MLFYSGEGAGLPVEGGTHWRKLSQEKEVFGGKTEPDSWKIKFNTILT